MHYFQFLNNNMRYRIAIYNHLSNNLHGKVKRVLFDGGYATFGDTGVPGWHYFLCDHTGSVRVVTDMWGRAEQCKKSILSEA